ncbi:hypothetical protein SDC9_138286 [bioreactor metagenome]|uniref:Uncharacterized protein n=2 Tax=root TaxID=1 RepID=A0A645DPL0_9ZZZZ
MRLVFGRATNAGTVFGSNYNTVTATFMYSGNDGVFADKIYASIGGNRYVTWYLYTVEMDNSEITIAGGNSVSVNENISIGRRIKGVRLYYNNSLGGGNSSGYIRTIRILSPCSPSYRYSSGKFYTRETHSDTWTECQKIKIGTCVLGSDGEVYQALPLSATQLQWMTNGNAETFLDA